MAHILRLKLQALYCPRLLPSPPLASKILDFSHIPWRCYAESALLEESCNSTLNANDIDGNSKAADGGEDTTRKGDGVEDKVSKGSDLDKLTNSICEKLLAKANVAPGSKDKGVPGQRDPLLTKQSIKTDKGEQWDQMVGSVRSLIGKTNAKAAASDKLGVPKTETNKDEHDFSDLDLPEAEGEFGVSRGPKAPNKSSLVMNAFGKTPNKRTSQLQYSYQHRSKDTRPLGFLESRDNSTTLRSQTRLLQFSHQQKSKNAKPLGFPDSVDSSTTLSSLMSPDNNATDSLWKPSTDDKNQPRKNIAMPGGVDSQMSTGKNTALSRAAEDGSSSQVRSQSSCKGRTQSTSDFKSEYDLDALRTQLRKLAPSATPRASCNDLHTGYMVCVQSLPPACNPSIIKASMAVYGEVLGFFKKAVRNDLFNVFIQFKTAQSMEGALAARKLQIAGKSYLIARTDQAFSTVVRLTKVSKDITQKQLLSICGQYGSIDDVRQRSPGVHDVFYEVKELQNMTRILDSLNEVTHNRSTWVANSAPALHPAVQKEALKSPEGQAWHEIQVGQALSRIETGIDTVWVMFEDLKELTSMGKKLSKR